MQSSIFKIRFWLACAAAAGAAITSGIAAAQSPAYPSRPITLVVPYAAGGSTDVAARLMQKALTPLLGQSIVVDNRTGAGGTIGTNYVAKANADGYTLLFAVSSHTINPSLYTLPFNTATDFVAVSKIASGPQVLVANKQFKYKTLAALLKIKPEEAAKIYYASGGVGTPGHMAGELFNVRSRLPFTHVPYKGGAPAAVDVMGGQVPLLWVSLPAVEKFIHAGDLVPLAVTTKTRSKTLPGVPTVAEFIPDYEVDTWYGLLAPAKTPDDVIKTLAAAIAKLEKDQAFVDAIAGTGAKYIGSSPSELQDTIQRELPLWADVIRKAGIKIEK